MVVAGLSLDVSLLEAQVLLSYTVMSSAIFLERHIC